MRRVTNDFEGVMQRREFLGGAGIFVALVGVVPHINELASMKMVGPLNSDFCWDLGSVEDLKIVQILDLGEI